MDVGSEGDDPIAIGDRLARGDSTVLKDVLSLYCPEIERILRKRYHLALNEQDIEDAVSIALGRLWDKREVYDFHVGSVQNYQYVIAKNCAADILKAKARQDALLRKVFGVVDGGGEQLPADHQIEPERSVRRRSRELPDQGLERQVLAEALQNLGAIDRQILIAYAEVRGRENWAAQVAREFGLPAGTIRVRRGRLIDRLRREVAYRREQQLLEETRTRAMTRARHTRPEKGKGENPALAECRHELIAQREQVEGILEAFRLRLQDMDRASSADSTSPSNRCQNFFKRLWSHARREQSLDTDSLPTIGGWMKAIDEGNESFQASARNLLNEASRAETSGAAIRGKVDVEQVERALMGLSQAFRRSMPDQIVRAKQGRMEIDSENDSVVWQGHPNARVSLLVTVRNVVSYHAKVKNPSAAEALAQAIVDSLARGRLRLPAFDRVARPSAGRCVYEWKLPVVMPQPIPVPEVGDEERSLTETAARPVEIFTTGQVDLRGRFPQGADALDAAIAHIQKSQFARARTGETIDFEREMAILIDTIADVAEGRYSRREIAAMLIAFVDLNWSKSDEVAVPLLEESLAFLANELEAAPGLPAAPTPRLVR